MGFFEFIALWVIFAFVAMPEFRIGNKMLMMLAVMIVGVDFGLLSCEFWIQHGIQKSLFDFFIGSLIHLIVAVGLFGSIFALRRR